MTKSVATPARGRRTARTSIQRKLAVILSADVAGYSRLMETNEAGTLDTLLAYRRIISSFVEDHRGRIFGTTGDSVIAEFQSSVDAVECVIHIQEALSAENLKRPHEERMEFRFGVHLGETLISNNDLYGTAVNIAARLQALAPPGGLYVSDIVRNQIGTRIPTTFVFKGAHQVKNISEGIYAFLVVGQSPPPTPDLVSYSPSIPIRTGPIELVRYLLEKIKVNRALKTRLNVVLKNSGQKSIVLLKGEITRKALFTAIDCGLPRYSQFLPQWDYDIDIDNDTEFTGHHYFEPNEVDTFNIIFAREVGSPMLSVYKIDLKLHFDEQLSPISISDLLIEIAGPSVILGAHGVQKTKAEWCECMLDNFRRFDEIGFDYRPYLDEKSLSMINEFLQENSS